MSYVKLTSLIEISSYQQSNEISHSEGPVLQVGDRDDKGLVRQGAHMEIKNFPESKPPGIRMLLKREIDSI